MKWSEWQPIYEEIISDFGYGREPDRRAARLLDELLNGHVIAGEEELQRLVAGKRVLVVGPARTDGSADGFDTIIVADSGMENALKLGLFPDIIVTDLDASGEMLRQQMKMNERGSVLVVHAHGDNIPALKRYLPEIHGAVAGTTQAEPEGKLHNFGGFTDGDRAVTMAAHLGAAEIALLGFDLENPTPKAGRDAETKRKKLEWAGRIIGMADPQAYIL